MQSAVAYNFARIVFRLTTDNDTSCPGSSHAVLFRSMYVVLLLWEGVSVTGSAEENNGRKKNSPNNRVGQVHHQVLATTRVWWK